MDWFYAFIGLYFYLFCLIPHPTFYPLLSLLNEPKVLLQFIYCNSFFNTHAGPDLQDLLNLNSFDDSGSGSGSDGGDVEEDLVMCFLSTDCGSSNGEEPIMVSSLEECCLMSPFQPRSFNILEADCLQCIGV